MTGSTEAGVTTAVARDFAIVAGPLQATERRVAGITLRHWRLRESRADARRALRRAARAMRAYGRWFGPYGRDELDLVEGPSAVARGAGLGMEYPELVLDAPARPGPAARGGTPVVARHRRQRRVREPWLDESFASYSGIRLAGRARSCDPPRGRPRLTASMKVFGSRGGRTTTGASCTSAAHARWARSSAASAAPASTA